jgi:hypothetical protein
VAGYFAVGLWLRGLEATRTAQPLALLDAYAAYRTQSVDSQGSKLAPHALTAGDREFTFFATILDDQRPLDGVAVNLSPAVSDSDWRDRSALNDYLWRTDAADSYEERVRAEARDLAWGLAARDPVMRERWVAERLAARAAIVADPAAALERFPVRYLALPDGRIPPDADRLGWELHHRGPRWAVWERVPAAARSSSTLDPTRRRTAG